MSSGGSGFVSKIKSFIGFLAVLFLLYTILVRYLPGLLDGFSDDSSGGNDQRGSEDATDVTKNNRDNYNKDYDSEEILSRSCKWKNAGTWWKATWEYPESILNEANDELSKLEYVVLGNGKRPSWLKKSYYNKLISDTVSVEEFWDNLYRCLKDLNEERVIPLSRVFKKVSREHGIKGTRLIEMVISFVQYIDYKVPTENMFEIIPPANTVMRNEGDCDTKSLLLAMILEDLGFDALLLYSSHYLHAIAAVDRGSGDYIKYRNKKYYVVETTAIGWKLGVIPPETDNMNYWYPVDL